MKICPQCQAEYDDTRNFCRHDGTPLETQQAGEKTLLTNDLTCSQCGKPLEAGEQFCAYCGARLRGALRPSVIKENPLTRSARKLRALVTEYYQQLSAEKREFYKGAILGFGAAILSMLIIVGSQKVLQSSQAPPSEQPPAVAGQNVPAPPSQNQPLSSSFARTVKGPGETIPQATTNSPPAAVGSPERTPPSGAGTLPSAEEDYAEGIRSESPEVSVPAGTYRVTTPTPLRSEPYDDASVVTELKRGIRISVVGAVGEYLEVRSKKGRDPGYVLKDHAVLVQKEK
jgi:hypothetical protein